jgi:hypothetical protein
MCLIIGKSGKCGIVINIMKRILLNLILSFFCLVFLSVSEGFGFRIKKIVIHPYENVLLVNLIYQDFPFQHLVLALKEHKKPVFINYEFKIYKKKFLFDKLIYQEKYFQKLYYLAETNLYYFKDPFYITSFKSAEKSVLYIDPFESYPLKWKEEVKKGYYLRVRVCITYYSHLTEELKYAGKIRKYTSCAESSYDFSQ